MPFDSTFRDRDHRTSREPQLAYHRAPLAIRRPRIRTIWADRRGVTTVDARTKIVAVHTPLLGNKTYSELLRRAFASSDALHYDAHWSTEQYDIHRSGTLERQLDRIFLKYVQRPFVRHRNLDFFPSRYELGASYWGRRTLNAILRSSEPDALHLHAQNVALLSVDVMRRLPTVISADTTSYLIAQQRLPVPWRWTLAPNHFMERTAFHAAAAVVAWSDWAAKSIVADHGVPPERVHVIPPGVEIEKFEHIDAEHAAGSERKLRILFVGGEFERKGGPLLLELFLGRFAARGDVELHIVTKDVVASPHRSIVVHYGIEPFSEAWLAMYASADIFVMPTQSDQSPLAYLEAMAARLPIVTTPVGAAPEIIVDGETGFIVSLTAVRTFGDRIERLLDDKSLRAQYGEAAWRRVTARYSAQTNAARLARVLVGIARDQPALRKRS